MSPERRISLALSMVADARQLLTKSLPGKSALVKSLIQSFLLVLSDVERSLRGEE